MGGIVVQPAQQAAFEVGVIRLGSRMLRVPDGQLFARQRIKIAFNDRVFQAQLEVPVQPGVEPGPGHRVVVVRKVFAAVQHHIVRSPEGGVELLQLGEALGGHFFRPVVGGGHALGLGGKQGGELDVPRSNAQERRVLTGATSLHGRADHHRGKRQRHSRIDRRQQHCLRASAAGPGDGDPFRIDLGQAQNEIQRPHRVPGLQPHHALQVGLGLRAVEPPVLHGIHLGPLLAKRVHDFARDLLGIGVAQHVPLPDHAAHAGQLHAHRLEATAAPLFEPLGPRGNFFAQVVLSLFRKPGVLPVTMGEQHGRDSPGHMFRSVEVARHE